MKTTRSRSDEKFSRKNAERCEDGTILWKSDGTNLTRIPVRMRYGTALLLSFKESSGAIGIKRSGPKALAVLWLRDITDNDEQTVELPLWTMTDGDYSALKQNYVPPDGSLDAWNEDGNKVKLVGSVWVHLLFKPGLSDLHHDQMEYGTRKKEAWEAYTREQAGGLRDSVGGLGDSDTNPQSQVNTVVSSESVENVDPGGRLHEHTEDDNSGTSSRGSKKGLTREIRAWRQGEKDLHQDHRGIMQMKTARTAEWVKDNVEEGIHRVKDRFAMKTRKPDVETEV